MALPQTAAGGNNWIAGYIGGTLRLKHLGGTLRLKHPPIASKEEDEGTVSGLEDEDIAPSDPEESEEEGGSVATEDEDIYGPPKKSSSKHSRGSSPRAA